MMVMMLLLLRLVPRLACRHAILVGSAAYKPFIDALNASAASPLMNIKQYKIDVAALSLEVSGCGVYVEAGSDFSTLIDGGGGERGDLPTEARTEARTDTKDGPRLFAAASSASKAQAKAKAKAKALNAAQAKAKQKTQNAAASKAKVPDMRKYMMTPQLQMSDSGRNSPR